MLVMEGNKLEDCRGGINSAGAKACLPFLVLINFLSSYNNWEVTTVKFSHLTKCMGVCLKR